MTELHLVVDRSRGVRAGVERALREAIRTLPPDTRLPSSRSLAADLGIARNTVADAYTQLVQEGYLTTARGAGTHTVAQASKVSGPDIGDSSGEAGFLFDLRPGRPDVSTFPVAAWNAATRHVLNTRPREALQYDDARGPAYAREVLAGYLHRARGVQADPDQIVLCSGVRQAAALLFRAAANHGARSFAYERPGQPAIPVQLHRAGLQGRPIQVDRYGLDVGQLGDAGGVLLTPAHQFPMGVPLAPKRRTDVLRWARATGAIVLEDDYDGEFRYDRQPIGALQGLAPDVVAYAGSASKTLAPGLRLGWLVVPRHLLAAVIEEKTWTDRHSDTLTQLTLAALIESGAYDRHVRAARLRYRHRRDDLIHALGNHHAGANHYPGANDRAGAGRQPGGIAAGLQLVIDLPGRDESAVLRTLHDHGINTFGMSHFGSGLPSALVIGYGAPARHAWTRTLSALIDALQNAQL